MFGDWLTPLLTWLGIDLIPLILLFILVVMIFKD